jgi:hypothetical protein
LGMGRENHTGSAAAVTPRFSTVYSPNPNPNPLKTHLRGNTNSHSHFGNWLQAQKDKQWEKGTDQRWDPQPSRPPRFKWVSLALRVNALSSRRGAAKSVDEQAKADAKAKAQAERKAQEAEEGGSGSKPVQRGTGFKKCKDCGEKHNPLVR